MANCQLTSASCDQPGSTSNGSDNPVLASIPEGRVGQVCKEWLVREDNNLAYRLQNEEIEQHYNDNRFKNQIVRNDIPLAKHLQQNEILEAQKKYENKLREQLEHDERIARRMEHRLWLEEEAAKKASEEADERLAKKLMEKEKAKQLKKRLEKEKQQVVQISQQLGADFRLEPTMDSGFGVMGQTLDRFARSSSHRIMTEDEQELDLSEFCMPPPPGLTPEELKLFLEEQDAEIAILLQHQELKRSRNPEKEKLAQIEAQDYAIAKMLQRMEKERSKRIKEKHRLQQQSRNPPGSDNNDDSFPRTSTPLYPNMVDTMIQNPKPENDYDIPENHLVDQMQNQNHDETYEEPYQILSEQQSNRIGQSFHNIAIDLDPTYRRRSKLKSSSSQGNLIESSVDDVQSSSSSRSSNANPFVQRLRDSLEKLPRSSTTSSRSSNTSSESGRKSLPKSSRFQNDQMDDVPPPLPPRDVSLMSFIKEKNNQSASSAAAATTTNNITARELPRFNMDQNNLLPPHHPQHPNRRFNQGDSSTAVIPVQGQRRSIISMDRSNTNMVNTSNNLNKSKFKNPDGCKTQ